MKYRIQKSKYDTYRIQIHYGLFWITQRRIVSVQPYVTSTNFRSFDEAKQFIENLLVNKCPEWKTVYQVIETGNGLSGY